MKTIKILFICHGNICRSTMAEFVMKYLVKVAGLTEYFEIDSAAVSLEAIGCDVHHKTREKLNKEGIPCGHHSARRIDHKDYEKFDHIIAMDKDNVFRLHQLLAGDPDKKVKMLLERDIADPWYTGNFDDTFSDVMAGCRKLLATLSTNQI